MQLELITREDFEQFRTDFFIQMRELLKGHAIQQPYLKSKEVKALLKCSDSTLQTLRISGQLPYSDVLGTKYYLRTDVQNLLEKNKKGGNL